MDHHHRIVALIIMGIFLQDNGAIKITVVNIPKVVRVGTEDPIVLDCDYDMGKSKNIGLTIKWYVGQDLLYQWIYGTMPKPSDEYKRYVDPSYRASNDSDTMYRAVKLVRPGTNLSGEYRCVVFTHDDEAEASGKMLVYSPANQIRLKHLDKRSGDPNRLTVTCLAEGIYPQPKITLRKDTEVIAGQKQDYKERDDGRFNAEAVAVMNMEALQLPVTLRCELYIQEANYTATREYVYSGASRRFPELLTPAIVATVACLHRVHRNWSVK